MPHIYLDNNATTHLHPLVAEQLAAWLNKSTANPASQHAPGRTARRHLEEAREGIADLLGARFSHGSNEELIFTSGGTEANNLALLGLAGAPPARVLVSSIEHPSVQGPCAELSRRGFDVCELPVDAHGVVQPDALAEQVTEQTALVSVMLANNETGVIQPVLELARLCRKQGIAFHTDAAQAVGKLPISITELDVSALSFTAHKIHGPIGIGGLLVRGVDPLPLHYGGFQQQGRRPGTESVALSRALLVTLKLWDEHRAEWCPRMAELRDTFENKLLSELDPVIINGSAAQRLPHVSNLSFPGVDRQALLMALDQAGVACATGSACASGSSEPSHVLLAMGLHKELVSSAIRFSLSALTTAEEVLQASSRIIKTVQNLRRQNQGKKDLRSSRQWTSKSV